eukprot:gene9146-1643_t
MEDRPGQGEFLYLAPGAKILVAVQAGTCPRQQDGCVRVVCISDTHCEHDGVSVPDGDVLVHAGDILTESGLRYVDRGKDKSIKTVKDAGVVLFERFAAWLGRLGHPHKVSSLYSTCAQVIIGGNHDLVLQGMGPARVREVLSKYCVPASTAYLDHEQVAVGVSHLT